MGRDSGEPSASLAGAVALLSCGALAYEILLLRLFSIIQWHHFAYLIISLALLGYGASGALLTVFRPWFVRRFGAAFPAGAFLFALSAPACFALAQRIGFNPLDLPWEPREALRLCATYLVLALPFLWAATAVGLALITQGIGGARGIGRLYGADLVGAALGSAGAVAALFALRAEDCLRLLTVAGALAGALPLLPRSRWAALGLATLGVAVAAAWPAAWLTPRLSPYKALSQALLVPEARLVAERSSPLGLVTAVASPRIPFRRAPGLSLACPFEPPEQIALFLDGDSPTTVDRSDATSSSAYLDYLPSALPYRLLRSPRVLVLGAGGATGVRLALSHGAGRVDAVELNPQVIELVKTTLGDFAGHPYDDPRVRVFRAEARSFAARRRAAYDLIEVSLLESGATAAAGVLGLTESYLYTVEALGDLIRCLAPGGYLCITRWRELPPRDTLKLFATVVTAIEGARGASAGRRLAQVQSWSTVTLLARNGDLDSEAVARLRAFCTERWFDVAYCPGGTAEEAGRYTGSAGRTLREGALALLGAERADFLRRYKFDIEPATDARPYFFHSLRWGALPELLRLRGRGGAALIEWAYLILLATLVQALAAGFLLILAPLAALGRLRSETARTARVGVYFSCLGLGFLFLEVAFLQRFTLFLGDPVYAAAMVLAGFLLFAGLGSRACGRLAARLGGRKETALAASAGIVAALAATCAFGLPALLRLLLPLPDAARFALTAALVAPIAYCMGMPFPLGIARLSEAAPELAPWAWGVNGWASVLSAPLATLLAIHAGFTAVVAAAAGLYLAAAWAGADLARPPAGGVTGRPPFDL